MQYLFKDLGTLLHGSTVVVELRNQANLRLMTHHEYSNFTRGTRYTFIGGRATRSPVHLTIPRAEHWVIVIDLAGAPGTVHATVTVRNPPHRTAWTQ
jgi:hypothetical protein